MKQAIISIILAILIPVGIYGICAFIAWNPLIMEWPTWMRGVYGIWVLIAIGKALDKK
jgi:hypothetical protein